MPVQQIVLLKPRRFHLGFAQKFLRLVTEMWRIGMVTLANGRLGETSNRVGENDDLRGRLAANAIFSRIRQ